MKALGFFKEFEVGKNDASDRSMIDVLRVAPGWREDEVVSYLESGIPLVDIMESTVNALGGAAHIRGGSSIMTDGTWVWRLDLAYYVRNYHLQLDEDFLMHASGAGFRIKEPDRETLRLLAEVVLRDLLRMG